MISLSGKQVRCEVCKEPKPNEGSIWDPEKKQHTCQDCYHKVYPDKKIPGTV